jgi:subtilisin-like proprotein convertase family protein
MRTRWLVLLACLLCLAGAWFFWQHSANSRTQLSALPAAAPAASPAASKILTPVYVNSPKPGTVAASTNPFAFRLSNTTQPLGQLTRDSHAILLENALIDASRPLDFSIPVHLRSQGDPGAYIVQARGPIDAAFRAMLAAAGAEMVSYIPNNAYLVRAQAGVADGLAGNPLTQAVTPYEPYYKIQSSLLTPAVGRMDLPDGKGLTLGLFTATASQTIKQIEALGWTVLSRQETAVGTIVQVQPPPGNNTGWTALATLSGTKNVEMSRQRIPANDLSRAATGVAVDTRTTTNYLNLSGSNVLVQVNDSGIDGDPSTGHPDLKGRVFGDLTNLVDTSGHGTHVAGIIAGSGLMSTTVNNARGSIMPGTNGQFRGKAPLAKLLAMNLNASDRDLQEAAARTNALISNNSWNYQGDSAYDLAAASYDAAVRDALPGMTGSQPVLFVFAAGNFGNGDDTSNPGSGNADTIQSPATAKNVITVGALQEFRNITNKVITISANGVTNTDTPWQPETSTSSRIAALSSRGNVGIGIEGTYGRFKPDVVAPGTFVVSTRSAQWNITNYFFINPTNHTVNTFSNIIVQPDAFLAKVFPVIPPNTVGADIYVNGNADSPVPFPDLTIYFGLLSSSPTYPHFTTNNQVLIPPDGGLTIASILGSQKFFGFNYGVSNSTANPISFSLTTDIVTTNYPGDYFLVLSNKLDQILGTPNSASTGPGPYYRYETGTSMSAADVSGVLALMQDYFTNTLHATPSPALLKAMLINGARVTSEFYNFQVQNVINYEGWGLINLPNSVPPGITTNANNGSGEAMLILDQSPTAALATGDSYTYHVTITGAAAALPSRITLAWTDPPGDPAAAIKLVNDLNLVVTNLSNPTNPIVYYGNDIPDSSIYNSAHSTTNTPVYDFINNVENVYLPGGSGTNFSVTVLGYRVNVNAVTAHTNNVVQDYALVISSGNGTVSNAFTVTTNAASFVSNPTSDQQITFVTTTNAPLLNQFAGASTPLLGTNQIQLTAGGTELNGIQLNGMNLVTLGMVNQWHFYVVTNTGAEDFTNAAFITFIPNTLSIPRMGVYQDSQANATRPEADIDLYVSADPGLTNLDPAVIFNADKSVGRGGTEFVAYSNSAPGKVYYVGVYSEDQEASEYGFIPIFTDIPFSQPGPNGSQIVNGLVLPVNILDGTPAHPGSGYVFALAMNPMEINRVVVTNIITHQNYGDLIGTLKHGTQNGLSKSVVLNNHDSLGNPPGPYMQIYDDSRRGDIAGSRLSDGPGSLNNFMGQQAVGPWTLTEVDDAHTQVGSVTAFQMLIEPHEDLTKGIQATLGPLGWYYTYIDVPAGATNLTFFATNITASGMVDFFVRYEAEPTLTIYDEWVQLKNPGPLGLGNTVSIGPPLVPGRYFIGLYNESTSSQTFDVWASIGLGAAPGQVIFSSSGPAPILDDAVTTNSIFVTEAQTLSSVDVALRVTHPRVSDLVFHLTSPDGTRVLLVENRGGTDTNGMGATYAITNMAPVTFSYIQTTPINAPSTNVIDTGATAGTLQINYNFWNAQPDEMVVYYQGLPIFDSGVVLNSGVFNVPYGPGLSTKVTIVMNPTLNPGLGDRWDYTVGSDQPYFAYLVLTEDTNKTTTPIKFAPVPFHGTATINTNAVWHSSFEGGPAGDTFYNFTAAGPGTFFPEGWHVDAGGVKVLTNGGAFEPTHYLDLDGTNSKSGPGTISTNLVTSPGQTYLLSFAYSPNPFDIPHQPDGLESGVQVRQNSDLLLTLVVTNKNPGPAWATTSIVFTATSASTKLEFRSMEGGQLGFRSSTTNGILLDAINLAAISATNGDIYYLPEQSLDTLAGLNSYGQWQLEIWDNRAGAGLTNTLESWQLRFNFPTPSGTSGGITNGLPQTNAIPAGSIQYYPVFVPTNADIATNILISTNGTLNLWFNPATLPSGTNSPGDILLFGATNGMAIFYTNGVPPLVPGSTYYLGVQNTNSFAISNYTIQVDFHFLTPVLPGGQPATNTIPTNSIVYYVVQVPTNADWATNRLLFATGPLNVWFNPTNAPVGTNPPDILLFGGAPSGTAIFGTNGAPPIIVPGGTYYLAVQNTNSVPVTYGIEVDFHLVWPSVTASNIVYIPITVPTNADFATNILILATGPLNLWFTTNSPPSVTNATDVRLLPNGIYPSGTNGSVVLGASTTPPLVPGSTYYLGVQNTNSFTVGFSIEVDFHLVPPPSITGPTITATNGGFLLQWQGPTNFQYEIQWTTNLLPLVTWYTVLNPDIHVVVTSTNGHFSWFDDGTLTGGFGPLKFYRVLGGLNLGLITGSGPVTNTVLAGATSQAVVSVPSSALWASNVLLSATGPLNVWFNQTNPPTGNPGAGDVLMLSSSTAGVFVLTGSSVPPLVPGTNYYLGFQNPGASNVTFVFDVTFGFPVTNPVSNFSITPTNGGVWLRWIGLTNYLYQVQWTTDLLPPPAWNTVSNLLLSSTNGIFTWFDDGSLTGGFGPLKFYRLIAWPLPPASQTLSFSSVTFTNLAGTNDLVLQWSAPTNYQYAIQWTTNLTLPISDWSLIVSPVLTLNNGVYTFIDDGQTGPPADTKFFRLFEY